MGLYRLDDADRAAIVGAINEMIRVFESCEPNHRLRRHGWTVDKMRRVTDWFGGFRDEVASGKQLTSWDRINMATWFEFDGITLHASDCLKDATYECTRIINSIVARLSPPEGSRGTARRDR